MTSSQVEKVVVGPGHAIMVYFLLAFGYSTALVSLIIEIIFFKSKFLNRLKTRVKEFAFHF